MKKSTYLVQRLKLRNPEKRGVSGFDKLFACDYMGAAEFEFGALPQSLKEICRNIDNYDVNQANPAICCKDGKRIMIVGSSDDFEEINQRVQLIAIDELRLKESAMMKHSIEGHRYFNFDGWWDVENHWFAIRGEGVAEDLFLALCNLAERWKGEGKI